MKASQGNRHKPPHVLLLNQSVGPPFLELAADVAREWGPCHLITGTSANVDDADVIVRLLPAYDRRNLFTRVISWLLFLFGAIKEIARVEASVLLLVLSNPPLLPLLAWLAHLVRQQPYVVLVYDVYPDMIVRLGLLSDHHLVTRAWRWLNRQIYRHAARVITIGRHIAETLQQYMPEGGDSHSIDTVPTWVDTERFIPRDKANNPFAAQTGQQDKVTVLYSGNIGFSHDISPLIEAAIRLQDEPHLHFLIIGDGPSKADLVRKTQMAQLSNVTFLSFQAEEVLPYSLAVVMASAYMAVNASLLSVWVGSTQYGGALLTILMAVQFIVVGSSFLMNYLYRATGQVMRGSIALFIESVTRVPLMIGLLLWVGLPGVPIAGIVTSSVFGWLAYRWTRRVVQSFSDPTPALSLRAAAGQVAVPSIGALACALVRWETWTYVLIAGSAIAIGGEIALIHLDPSLDGVRASLGAGLGRLRAASVDWRR